MWCLWFLKRKTRFACHFVCDMYRFTQQTHPGNVLFRHVVGRSQTLYRNAPQKHEWALALAARFVQAGARFLTQVRNDPKRQAHVVGNANYYYYREAPYARVLDKFKKGLRAKDLAKYGRISKAAQAQVHCATRSGTPETTPQERLPAQPHESLLRGVMQRKRVTKGWLHRVAAAVLVGRSPKRKSWWVGLLLTNHCTRKSY